MLALNSAWASASGSRVSQSGMVSGSAVASAVGDGVTDGVLVELAEGDGSGAAHPASIARITPAIGITM
ncbi:hypothetical protein GCM10011600_01250 [Pseudolysinimonas yzui]|uniref:Uncharacterized protein n=1 Tax=Pseudolysinimonas yzui TaxID=2708254 RepID=A0A8J3GMR0_9MICO|nr:hypothetical protein GCM10011600_01250 [Pseudolysinimonas yzui]